MDHLENHGSYAKCIKCIKWAGRPAGPAKPQSVPSRRCVGSSRCPSQKRTAWWNSPKCWTATAEASPSPRQHLPSKWHERKKKTPGLLWPRVFFYNSHKSETGYFRKMFPYSLRITQRHQLNMGRFTAPLTVRPWSLRPPKLACPFHNTLKNQKLRSREIAAVETQKKHPTGDGKKRAHSRPASEYCDAFESVYASMFS